VSGRLQTSPFCRAKPLPTEQPGAERVGACASNCDNLLLKRTWRQQKNTIRGRANNQQAQVCPILAPSADLRSAEQNLVVFLRYNLHGMCFLRDDMSERHGSPDLPGIWPTPIVHAIGLLAAAAALARGDRPQTHKTDRDVAIGGLIAMLGCSAAGTILLWCRGRDFLRRLDQSAIFLMIAATYTPVHHALPQGGCG
jgi:hypothetical protein